MNISEQYLQALVDISREINSIQSQQPLLEKILEIAIHQLSAERGFVLLKDAETGELQSRAAHIPPGESQQPDEMISQTALNSVIEKQQPILTFDTLSDAQFDDSQSVVAHKIRSIACVPLLQKGKLIGAIYIDSRGQIASFTRQSLDFLNAFANQAAIAIENAQFVDALRRENDRLQQEVQQKYTFKELVGESPAMEELFHLMTRVLNKDTTVLITGETGTGKEVVARAIHFNGTRKDKPFVPVNSAAIPENLLESELFGFKKGAFTGANADKQGLVQLANGGTLFLDEVGELPQHLQAKLLRFLQEREIMPVGAGKAIPVDVRIIAATNRDLAEEVRQNRFREDLYYRLNVIPMNLPPLRERRKDILLLASHFRKKFAQKMHLDINEFTPEALKKLSGYHWPGNVRELENVIERAMILAQPPAITDDDILLKELHGKQGIQAGMSLDELSKTLLEKTLAACEGNKTRAAEMMGVSLRWIHYKIKEWQLDDSD